jgi:hypothetical protein
MVASTFLARAGLTSLYSFSQTFIREPPSKNRTPRMQVSKKKKKSGSCCQLASPLVD